MASDSPIVQIFSSVNDSISGWYDSITSFFSDNLGEIIFVLSCCLGVFLAFYLARLIQQFINAVSGRDTDNWS